MKLKQLYELIENGENKHVEFKQILCDGVFKTMCAFRNTDGGVILIGVNDDGVITGCNPTRQEYEKFKLEANSWDENSIFDEIIHVGKKTVWAIRVIPVYPNEQKHKLWKGNKYQRIGCTTRVLK